MLSWGASDVGHWTPNDWSWMEKRRKGHRSDYGIEPVTSCAAEKSLCNDYQVLSW